MPLKMKPTLHELEQRSKALELDQAQLTAVIARLREEEAEAAKVPWEPKNGTYYLDLTGYPREIMCARKDNRNGDLFETRKAAEKAAKFFTFFQRLYQLALECNATHGPTSLTYVFGVRRSEGRKWVVTSRDQENSYPTQFFTSRQAAGEAADIMNRDKWVMPTM